MAKTRTTKFQTYPQLYQFGGLNLPFLDYYTDLNKQWGNFWRGGDYFKQPEIPPTGMYGDPTAKLHNTITANNTASGRFKTAKEAYSKHYTGDTWDDDAHNFYYKQDWEARNPNATQTDKDRFDQYASFEKTANNLLGPKYTEALINAGINPGDYDSWFKGRKAYSDKAGQQFDAAPGVRKHYEQTQKELANAINNTAGGIFSGLNYMNAYTPPEKINMQQGSKGVMYSQYGTIVPSDPPNDPYKDFIKGPGTMYSPMMKEFGGVKIPASKWTHFPSGDHAVSALESLLFSGRSKYYHNDTKVRDALQKYSGGDYSSHKLAEKTLGSLNPKERLQLVADIIKREITAESYNANYAGAIASRRIGPSTMKLQVTSRQDGGNVNVTGYTPGTPTMDNSMNEIPSGNITMEQTPIPLLAIGKGGSDNGLLKILQPNSKGYNFKSKSTIEMPLEQQQLRQRLMMAQKGIGIPEQEGGLPTTERRAPISIFKSLRAKGYLQEYDEDNFNKLSAQEQDVLFKTAVADFNSKQLPVTGKITNTIIRPLTTQLDEFNTIPKEMTFDEAFAEASSKGLKQFSFNGGIFTTEKDPNPKRKPKSSLGKSKSIQTINTSRTGLAKDLLDNKQFGGLADMVQNIYSSGVLGNYSPEQAEYLQQLSNGEYVYATPEFNAKMLQGFNSASPQTQGGQLNIPMLPTINPSIVEPMSGLGFNRDKLQAKLRVNATGNMTPFEVAINNSNSVVSKKGDPYEYKVVNGIWQARKRGSKNWITLRDHNMIEAVSNYFTDQTDLEMDEYSLKKSYNKSKYQYGGYIPKFQYGGSVNDQHAVPIFSSHLEEFGLTELQTEKDEVAFMPDGSIVDVKAKKLHKHQDKNNVSDIMQSGTYIFSNDPKMKFGIKSKIGGVELGDMKLGKSVFKYKENEVTPGPEDIMLKDMFFNGSKKELTTAEIAKNVKKNLPIVDMKNDYFADRAIAENKDQRKEYLSILKAFNEYKKPKPTSVPKAQYGMPIQNTQNGLDGVMGYGDKQMDPFKRADNNLISMWKMPQPSIPSIPKMYNNGGYIPHAQFGWLGDAIDAIGGWSRKAERRQREKNEFLRREAQGYRDNLQRGVDTAGAVGVGSNLATYAAALNVPLQRYDDQSETMAMYNAAANRAAQRLEAAKYTASQGIGGASSLARYNNPTNYGDYLSKVQSQSDNNISRINQAIADLDMARTNQNINFISTRNAGRNQSLNARDTQLYNANIQGLGNVGRSAQEAIFNSADTRYRMGSEKMAYDAYLEDRAKAAKQEKQQQIRGYANEIGGIGLSIYTGGIPIKGLTPEYNMPKTGIFDFQNPKQMSPANQQFNSNYDGRFTTYNTIDSGGLVDRSGTMLNINSKTGVPWYINPATGRPWGE